MKRKRQSKRAVKAAQVAWVCGRGRYAAPPPPPRAYRTETDLPDRVMVALAALVPPSAACEGHDERMRAHMERVAREGVQCCGSMYVLCFACGRRETRLVARRWASRPILSNRSNRETYCPECFARWGWGEPVTCNDERGQ